MVLDSNKSSLNAAAQGNHRRNLEISGGEAGELTGPKTARLWHLTEIVSFPGVRFAPGSAICGRMKY
jgi:hypothetical protein